MAASAPCRCPRCPRRACPCPACAPRRPVCTSCARCRRPPPPKATTSSTLRNAVIAENVLEYEISALEYGISVVEGSAEFGRGLYVKELEPEYQNIAEKPRYANLEEITRQHGDRLGPEGQNLEDEVFYENVPSARRMRPRSATAVSSPGVGVFYGGVHGGTFPQYMRAPLLRRPSLGTAKKEMCEVKQQRLWLAQDEYKHLSSALTALAASRTSLCSSGSGGSARYDPELLRSDVALARGRVARLRRELRQVRAELSCTQQGVDTLHSVEQKISTQQGCYNITEAQAIMTELRNIQKSLTSGEKEKAELMQSLAKLKDDLTRLQLGEISPDTSTLSLPQEKLSTASQTDLCADLVPIGTRLAEMARMRLQYDESRKRIQHIQQQLADLEDKVQPGQAESDKDRLLLFQEKEQLLRELRSITPRTRSKQEMTDIQLECKRLEQDLNNALEMSNRCIADRLRLHEEKQLLLQQLRDALRCMTTLESQLKSLSASTLSVSSSSSLGSLSTASSKGSLSSGLSFTDIYGGPQCITAPLQLDKPIDMVDLHRRVERLLRGSAPSLSPRSPLGSPPVSPAAPPPYAPPRLDRGRLEERLAELRLDEPPAPLSPISETPPPPSDHEDLLQSTSGALSGSPSSSGLNSRSVSAAVSDESVAGDSGVFEASCRLRGAQPSSAETAAQVQVKLQYSQEEQTLYVGVQKVRNLQALSVKEDESVYIRAVVLPAGREAGAPLPAPLRLPLPLPAPLLRAQTLRLQACRRQHCLGFAQVSLAELSLDLVSVRWYNVLALATTGVEAAREESSDDSTLIPSQTSTLTRNQGGGESMLAAPADSPVSSDDEDDEDDEPVDEELLLGAGGHYSSSIHQIMEEGPYLEGDLDGEPEDPEQQKACTQEKETNTECNFCPEARRRGPAVSLSEQDRLAIKRSQTFSPTPQLGKNHYICRLNRSESDSSMPLYRRGGASPPAPFDRHAATRRSLRWGRVPGTPAPRGARHAPRTSLDLQLDLHAQHRRLSTLKQEIEGLRNLKQRLEVAREQGDTAVASWAAEDSALEGLCERGRGEGATAAPGRRATRALQRACRDLYRLRRTRAPKGKPDIITFKEKMAFFTRYHSTVPDLPSDEDILAEHDPDTLKRSDAEQLSRILDEAVSWPELSAELAAQLGQEGPSPLTAGYRVRRSGRCSNVMEKSQKELSSASFEDKTEYSAQSLDETTRPLRTLGDPPQYHTAFESSSALADKLQKTISTSLDETLQPAPVEKVPESPAAFEEKSAIRLEPDVRPAAPPGPEEEAGRFQYVVDRVLGVQV